MIWRGSAHSFPFRSRISQYGWPLARTDNLRRVLSAIRTPERATGVRISRGAAIPEGIVYRIPARTLGISAWFEPRGRIRSAPNCTFEEIDIYQRSQSRGADWERHAGNPVPFHGAATFPPPLSKRRNLAPSIRTLFLDGFVFRGPPATRPPPWVPTDEAVGRSLAKWQASHPTSPGAPGIRSWRPDSSFCIGRVYRIGRFGGLLGVL